MRRLIQNKGENIHYPKEHLQFCNFYQHTPSTPLTDLNAVWNQSYGIVIQLFKSDNQESRKIKRTDMSLLAAKNTLETINER